MEEILSNVSNININKEGETSPSLCEVISNDFNININKGVSDEIFDDIKLITNENIKGGEYTRVALKLKSKKGIEKKEINLNFKLPKDSILKNSQWEKGSLLTDYRPSVTEISQRNAELKIGLDGIKTEVKHIQDDYVTGSEFTQTAEQFRYDFLNSGSDNELFNSDLSQGSRNWHLSGGDRIIIEQNASYSGGGIPVNSGIRIGDCTNAAAYARQIIKPKNVNSPKYRCGCWVHMDNVNDTSGEGYVMAHVYVQVMYTDGSASWHNQDLRHIVGNSSGWKWVDFGIALNEKQVDYIEFYVYKRNTTGILRVTQIYFREGDVASNKWRAHPGEVHSQSTIVDGQGITVEMADGSGAQGSTRLGYDGLSIFDSAGNRKAWFGQDDTAYIQTLTADKIVNRHLLKWAERAPGDLYVGPQATGDGTGRNSSNKANSITGALEWHRQEYGCYLYRRDLAVHIDSGTYNEHVYIGGWLGTGVLRIKFNAHAVLYGSITVEENTIYTYVIGGRTGYNNNDGCILEARRQEAIIIRNCNCRIEGFRSRPQSYPNYGGDFVNCQPGARVSVGACDIVKYYSFVVSDGMATFHSLDNKGDVYYLASRFYSGELYFLGVNHPMIDNDYFDNTWNTHMVHNRNEVNSQWIPKDVPPPPPPPQDNWQWMEQSFTASNLRTITEGSGSGTTNRDGVWGQGNWSSYQAHRGYADLGSGPSSWCSGGRNFTAWITLRRQNTSHGNSTSSPPQLVTPGGGTWNSGQSFARGATHTIQLPSDITNAIVNGSMKTLQMWAGRNTAYYSFYDITSIKIKCEKKV